jgi:tetratricopeptide (TPR) repeat protein
MTTEGLSEEYNSSMKLSEVSSPDLLTQAMNAFPTNLPSAQDGTTPSLPPAMAAMKNKSGHEILKDLNKLPLFMTELEENDEIEAMKALAYEGTPAEVSQGFKERGNESFKDRGWKDAKEFYGKAIQVLLGEVRKRQKGEEEQTRKDGEEVKKEIAILEACLVNRAACHLELKNFRSCTLDCASALRINAMNVKAYYRSAKALLALGRIAEADDACARGLAVDPENKSLQAVSKDIMKKNKEIEAKKEKELERQKRRRQEEVTLKAALKARGIKTRKTTQPPEMEDAKIELVPDPVDPTSTLSFPAVLLYPLHLESDFIKRFNETEVVGDHLSYIFPLPWDKERLYTPCGVECYMETITGGLVKVGRKVSLLKVLSSGNIEVVDEVVKIFVVPKGKASEWVQDFKREKVAEKPEP